MEVYGEDGDTITLKNNKGELKLSDIYNGETASTGSYTKNKEKIEQLESQVAELKKALEDSSKSEGEKSKELVDLKALLSETTATEDKILKNYTAYKDGALITGTMENIGAVSTTLDCGQVYKIPAGYHNGSGKITANSIESQLQKRGLNAGMPYVSGGILTVNPYSDGRYNVSISDGVNIGTSASQSSRDYSSVVIRNIHNYRTLTLEGYVAQGYITCSCNINGQSYNFSSSNYTLDLTKLNLNANSTITSIRVYRTDKLKSGAGVVNFTLS